MRQAQEKFFAGKNVTFCAKRLQSAPEYGTNLHAIAILKVLIVIHDAPAIILRVNNRDCAKIKHVNTFSYLHFILFSQKR